MKRWTLKNILTLILGLSSFILFASIAVNYKVVHFLEAGIENLTQNDIVVTRSIALTDMMHDGIRGIVYEAMGSDAAKIPDLKKELDEQTESIHEYMKTSYDHSVDPQMKELVRQAQTHAEDYVASAQAVFVDLAQSKSSQASLEKFNVAFKNLEETLENLGTTFEQNTQKNLAVYREQMAFGDWMSLVALVLGLMSLGFSIFVGRSLMKNFVSLSENLRHSSEGVGQSSKTMSSISSELAQAAQSQASSVQETAASLEEISSLVSQTSENGLKLKDNARRNLQNAGDGRKFVEEMLRSMQNVKASSEDVGRAVNDSNSNIREIVKIISEIGERTKVINDIVFQTKLLSFNASVEAARAGEHGKGFAVVAEEVGSLAQMSGSAAQEISTMLSAGISKAEQIMQSNSQKMTQLLEDVRERIDHTHVTAQRCGQSFESINAQIADVTHISEEIATAIEEQSKGLQEINKAIALFDQVSQQASLKAQDSSGAARDLEAQYEMLETLLRELGASVGGRSAAVCQSTESNVTRIEFKKPSSRKAA